MNSNLKKILYRWKGKIVKESVYKQRIAISESRKKKKEQLMVQEEPKIPVEGRRIIDLQLLGKHLKCTSCKEYLSLRDIKSETRRGLASIFHVQCRCCSVINYVPTSSKTLCKDNSKRKLYDVNCEFVHGAAQTGIPLNRLNKLLGCLNIPHVQSKLFQRYKEDLLQSTAVPATKNPATNNFSAGAALATVETVPNSETAQ